MRFLKKNFPRLQEKGITVSSRTVRRWRAYHPPQSPDLNPIEHVWGWIKDKLAQLDLHGRAQLIAAIKRLWEEIPQETIDDYIRHLRHVYPLVVKLEGRRTKGCDYPANRPPVTTTRDARARASLFSAVA